MLQKIKRWWKLRRKNNIYEDPLLRPEVQMYTLEQVENAYRLGYTDGKRDGLAIARQQAVKSLKEILWQTNKTPENRK